MLILENRGGYVLELEMDWIYVSLIQLGTYLIVSIIYKILTILKPLQHIYRVKSS